MNTKNKKLSKKQKHLKRHSKKVKLITAMPEFSLETLEAVHKIVIKEHYTFLDNVLLKIKTTNQYLAQYIMLVSGDDEVIRKRVTGAVMFINECGAIPIINKHVFESFMCFDESPEETERIMKDRIDAIKDEQYLLCAQQLCGDAHQTYCFVLCLYILLDMQCKTNMALTLGTGMSISFDKIVNKSLDETKSLKEASDA